MDVSPYGNPIPKTTVLTVIALLEFKGGGSEGIGRSGESGSSKITGVGQVSGNWSGFLVNPTLLPNTIKPGMVAEAEIVTGLQRGEDGGIEPVTEKGEFILQASPQSPYLIASGIEDVTPITGTFTRTVQ